MDSVAALSDCEERGVAALLGNRATYAGSFDKVDVVETHIARVFLAGDDVYKVKKRVRLPFLDFTTLESRHRAAAREFEINQPHAPEIYLGLVPIVRRADDTLALGGDGEIVDWAVHMRRFREEAVLFNQVKTAPLSDQLAKALAEMLAAYHHGTTVTLGLDGKKAFAPIVRQLTEALGHAGDAGAVFAHRFAPEFERIAPLLTARGRAGCIRRCHGDLHLANIVLLNGVPKPFDALEFSEALATIDVLYDLAFLLMDLDIRSGRHAANVVLNEYVGADPVGGEIAGLACLPLFLAARAGVRAVVAIARGEQLAGADKEASWLSAQRYLGRAGRYLAPPEAVLVAVGGLSGTGKSTLAAQLAAEIGAAPGALHLRSDVERKRLFGVPETQRLERQHYRIGVAQRVYTILEGKARGALGARHSVIVDAVFAKPEERADIEQVARNLGLRFVGLWLDAPAETLLERVARRRGDASDADRRVVKEQLGYDLGPIPWSLVDASGSQMQSLENARAAVVRDGIELQQGNLKQ